MEVNGGIRESRILVESTIDAIKEKKLGGDYAISFSVTLVIGSKNESETLSYMDKLVRALKQFPESDRAKLVLHTLPINKGEEELLKLVETKYEAIAKLAQGLQLQKP